MCNFFLIVTAFLLCSQTGHPENNAAITGYSAAFAGIRLSQKKTIVGLRKFFIDNRPYRLCLDPDSLIMLLLPDTFAVKEKGSFENLSRDFSRTPYVRLINTAMERDKIRHGAGIRKLAPDAKGMALTIDLCPSKKRLDKKLFIDLINPVYERPVPIGIAVSGIWINQNQADFEWIKDFALKGNLNITWINHSFSHKSSGKNGQESPLDSFLVQSGTDMDYEILKTEVLLLEKGVVPSVFFRFPGLVSNKTIFDHVIQLGLIPLSADTWIAKNEFPVNGSIILIHGNGNEPAGARIFSKYLLESSENNETGLKLVDLRKNIIQ